MRHLVTGKALMVWHMWTRYVSVVRGQRGFVKRFVRRMASIRIYLIWRAWTLHVSHEKHAEQLMKRVIRRMTSIRMYYVWRDWMMLVATQRYAEAQVDEHKHALSTLERQLQDCQRALARKVAACGFVLCGIGVSTFLCGLSRLFCLGLSGL
jgi:hypothetical protein